MGRLREDLAQLAMQAQRRDVLRLLAGATLLSFLGHSSDAAAGTGTCARIPEETAGPYVGDGSNGPNALALDGIVRRDIRSSIGGGAVVPTGVPLALTLQLVNLSARCAPLVGAAVYVWHCDAQGRYSLYSSGVSDETWLRGIQRSDSGGRLTFLTVFPGCYPGRWPHIHLEVYPSLAVATAGGTPLATSQIALPQAACAKVYAGAAYAGSAANLASLSVATDAVFSDRLAQQLATVTGGGGQDYAARLTIAVPA